MAHERDGVNENRDPVAGGLLSVRDGDPVVLHQIDQLGIVDGSYRPEFLAASVVYAVDVIARDSHGFDFLGVYIVEELRERRLGLRPRPGLPHHRPQQHHHHDDDDPENCSLNVRIHSFSYYLSAKPCLLRSLAAHSIWKTKSAPYWTSCP